MKAAVNVLKMTSPLVFGPNVWFTLQLSYYENAQIRLYARPCARTYIGFRSMKHDIWTFLVPTKKFPFMLSQGSDDLLRKIKSLATATVSLKRVI